MTRPDSFNHYLKSFEGESLQGDKGAFSLLSTKVGGRQLIVMEMGFVTIPLSSLPIWLGSVKSGKIVSVPTPLYLFPQLPFTGPCPYGKGEGLLYNEFFFLF
jgi:hypothetical protein